MTNEEQQAIINAVLSSIRTNSRTIAQLTEVPSISDDDVFELGGGKKAKYSTVKAPLATAMALTAEATTRGNADTALGGRIDEEVAARQAVEVRTKTLEEQMYAINTLSTDGMLPTTEDHDTGGWKITEAGVVSDVLSSQGKPYYKVVWYDVTDLPSVIVTVTASNSFRDTTDRVWAVYDDAIDDSGTSGTLLGVSTAIPRDGCDEHITLPEGAKYLYVALRTTPAATGTVRVQTDTSRIDELASAVAALGGGGGGEFDLTEVGFYQYSSGKIVGSDKTTFHTKLVPISGRRWLWFFTRMGAGGAAVAFFDANKQYIKDISINGDNYDNTMRGCIDLTASKYGETANYDPTAGTQAEGEHAAAAYVSVSFYGTSSYATSDEWAFYHASLGDAPGGLAKPLDVLIFGDSITTYADITVSGSGDTPIAGGGKTTAYRNKYYDTYTSGGATVLAHRWPFLLEQAIPCRDLRNYALSGASFKTKDWSGETNPSALERRSVQAQITLAIQDATYPTANVFPTTDYYPDIIIFALGVNDGTTFGTAADAMAVTGENVTALISALNDTANACESARKAFLRVRQQWPLALMFCVLPLQLASRDQLTSGINEQLRELAGHYGAIVIDGGRESGIVREFEVDGNADIGQDSGGTASGTLLKDGLHPNREGQKRLARCIISKIKNNYIDWLQ